MFFTRRTNWIVASGTNGARFGRSDLLPSRLIGNNKGIPEYSKFHIRGEFSRNCSSFSKSRPTRSDRLVERPERERCSGGMIPVGTGFKVLVHRSRQHNNIPLETKKKNIFEGEMRDILFHHRKFKLLNYCIPKNFHDTPEQSFTGFNDS